MNPLMTLDEICLFKKYLAGNGSECYFEYGCGGSTFLADSHDNIRSIVSVESSIVWIEKVKVKLKSNKTKFIYIDINADEKNWGVPKDRSKIENWRLYPDSILKQDRLFDLILVDGRFRVACCAAASIKMHKDSILMLHDCDRYKEIPLKKIDQKNSLGVFIKDEHSDEELFDIIKRYERDYS